MDNEADTFYEKKYRIHANVTKEIEITQDQAERLRNYINGCTEHAEIDDIKEMFSSNSGSYEGGYVKTCRLAYLKMTTLVDVKILNYNRKIQKGVL